MKKKIIIGVTICLFMMATMFSLNMPQQSNISNISLKNIAALSMANAEDDYHDYCNRHWHGPFCQCDQQIINEQLVWVELYYNYIVWG